MVAAAIVESVTITVLTADPFSVRFLFCVAVVVSTVALPKEYETLTGYETGPVVVVMSVDDRSAVDIVFSVVLAVAE